MGTLTVLFTVGALLIGGQTLFLDALRFGLVVALTMAVVGRAGRSGDAAASGHLLRAMGTGSTEAG